MIRSLFNGSKSVTAGLMAALTLLIAPALSAVEPEKAVELIVDVKRGEVISETELLARLAGEPLIVIGEKHDNARHHAIEKQLLKTLVDVKTGVIFEMLDSRHQQTLLNVTADESLNDLYQQLQFSLEAGWPWEFYGELFFTVLQQKGRLIAGNMSRDEIREVYQKGLDSTTSDHQTAITLKPLLQDTLLQLVYDGHCQAMPKESLQPMVDIQLAKDARMAASRREELSRHILIAGAVHARKDLGVPRHWQLNNEAAVVVQLVEKLQDDNDWRTQEMADTARADFLWITAAAPDQDYCAQFKHNPQK